MPRRKPAKSEPAAAPVKVKVPRGSCCERMLNCWRRKSPPQVKLCGRGPRKTSSGESAGLVAGDEYCASASAAMPLAKLSEGGPQLSGSWLLPVMPAAPETLKRLAKKGSCACELRLNW